MDQALQWPADRIVLDLKHDGSVAIVQAPAIATTGIAALDMLGAGYWPGARIEGEVVTFDALNGCWCYRIEPPGRYAADADCTLTLIEGTPLVASPQDAAQGSGDEGAPGAPAEGQRAQGRDVFPQPRRQDGQPPCGECHLHPGEVCDICGAVSPRARATNATSPSAAAAPGQEPCR